MKLDMKGYDKIVQSFYSRLQQVFALKVFPRLILDK